MIDDDGKTGFLITVGALIVLMGSLGAMALRGGSDVLLTVSFCSIVIAVMGHFLLDGAEFRKEMLRRKKEKNQKHN